MTKQKPTKTPESAKTIVSKLADNKAFGRVKSITINLSKTSPGYLLKVIFFVELEMDAIPEKIKVRCTSPGEAAECMRMIIQNHRETNPQDEQTMNNWDTMVSGFEEDPSKGISLYLPS